MKNKRYFNNKKKHYFALGGTTDLNNIILGSGGVGGSVGMQGTGGIVNTLSGLQKAQASLGLGTGGLGGLTGMGGIANGVANGISTLINPNGNSTGVGNVLQGIGSVASNIPGVGGIIGAGVGLVGGLVNSLFGSNINEEFVDQTENQIKQQANWVSNASDNAGLLSDWSSYTDLGHVSRKDVGSDGLFSNKAKKLTKKLNRKADEANDRARQSFINSAANVDRSNDLLINSNYFGEGGGIHIKKKNRGKFTSYCGGKVTSECIARGKRSSSPTIRKRATFAQNARKFKHAYGGFLEGMEYDLDESIIKDLISKGYEIEYL